MYHIYNWTWCNVEDGFWVLDLLLGKSCNEEGHPAKIEPACSFISFISLFRLKFNMKYLIVSAFFCSFDPFRSFYTHPNWACPCAKKQSPQSHPRGLLLLHDRPHPRNFCAARNAVENFHGNAGTKEYTSTIQKPSISALGSSPSPTRLPRDNTPRLLLCPGDLLWSFLVEEHDWRIIHRKI